jgi:hypothetical protein
MAYTTKNFKSGAELKRALKAGEKITCYSPGIPDVPKNGTGSVFLEGPHFPQPHKWYLKGWMENGFLVSVK